MQGSTQPTDSMPPPCSHPTQGRWWQAQDRTVLTHINTLLKDIQRNSNEGMGKPEALPQQPTWLLVAQNYGGTQAGLQNRW